MDSLDSLLGEAGYFKLADNIRDDWPDEPPEGNKQDDYLLDSPQLQQLLFAPVREGDEKFEPEVFDADGDHNDVMTDIINSNILNVGQLLARDRFIKKAWNVQELINSTSKKSIKYQGGCTSSLKRSTPKYGRWLFSVKCGEKWSDGPYNIKFKLLRKGRRYKDLSKRQIQVSCNCNAWKYNGADYNAVANEYSENQYSDGSAPNIMDKKRKHLICKHVASCIPIVSEFLIPKDFK